jgi:hypothetical protein
MSEPWMTRAACRGLTDLFFAERGDHYAVLEARKVCDECPVWRECLDWSVTPDAPAHGVLAGLTYRERAQLRRDVRGNVEPATLTRPRVDTPTATFWIRGRPTPASHTWTRAELLELRAADG